MTEAGQHRKQPTEQEKFAAAGAEDYLGVPISDEELADVWVAEPDKAGSDQGQAAKADTE
jgi:CheY-like chemotaxis protein